MADENHLLLTNEPMPACARCWVVGTNTCSLSRPARVVDNEFRLYLNLN